jgi:AcrR family transcriptional regulator
VYVEPLAPCRGSPIPARRAWSRVALYSAKMKHLVHSSPNTQARVASKQAKPTRTNDPVGTMTGILEAATQEFAAKGLSGGRIDAIALATRTSKRMIYYYFGSKQGLYLAVLEESYRKMRHIESELQLDDLPPEQALRTLVEFIAATKTTFAW